jgi:hypothetical protein
MPSRQRVASAAPAASVKRQNRNVAESGGSLANKCARLASRRHVISRREYVLPQWGHWRDGQNDSNYLKGRRRKRPSARVILYWTAAVQVASPQPS